MSEVECDETGVLVHKGCGGTVFVLETGEYWCFGCDEVWYEGEERDPEIKEI